MRPNSRETFKLLIFQYLRPADLLIFLRNHQVNWSKCHSNAEQISQNPSLNHLIDPSFKEVKRVFIINLQPRREKKGNSGTPDQPNLRPNHLRAQVTAMHVEGSQFKPSWGHWNVIHQNLANNAITVSNLGIN